MLDLSWEADGLCFVSRILVPRGGPRTHSSKRHIPKLPVYPGTPLNIPSEENGAPTVFWSFWQRGFPLHFYLSGVSPFVVDLKNIAREGLEGIPASEGGRATFPHHRFEEIISQRLEKGGHLDEWEERVRKLDQADGLEDFMKMKRWTDQIAAASGEVSLSIVYQFDKNRLRPMHLRK
jgi:hypothetical protein